MPVINVNTLATGNLEGAAHGATISLIFDHSEPGMGPRLHRHPYDETWVVQEGNLTGSVARGGNDLEATHPVAGLEPHVGPGLELWP